MKGKMKNLTSKKKLECHHMSTTKTYNVWRRMRRRCRGYAAKPEYYVGVRVCARWDRSFEAFLEDIGGLIPEGYVLHRLDSHGDYEPGNVVIMLKSEHGKLHARRRPRRRRAA